MLEVGFKTYYDRTVISAERSGRQSSIEKTAEKLLAYAGELLLEEEADGRLRLIRSIIDDGYIYFEAEPFDFSKERFDGITDAFSWLAGALSEEYPDKIRLE